MHTSPQHILVISSYLHVPGGYEKAVVTTANLFTEKGHRVSLLILDETDKIFYPLNKDVQVFQKNVHFGITERGNFLSRKVALAKDIGKLRNIISALKPDIIIASEYQFAIACVLCGGKKWAKIYSWEHHHFGVQKRNSFWHYLFRFAYPKLTAVVALNEDERKLYSSFSERAVVIPNFIHPLDSTSEIVKEDNAVTILTVTRLNNIKGIDLLMQVAAQVLKANAAIKWKVIGYGEQKEIFLNFIRDNNLTDQLFFVPAVGYDITPEYQQASFFVLTSRNECFPLTLIEAQSCGLPCIAFDCETGPRHIIQHNKNGYLIEKENTSAMADAILQLSIDKTIRKRMSENAVTSVQQFNPDAVYQLWQKLF